MKQLLFILFLNFATFAQSPFWTIEGFFGGDTTPPDLPSSILATGSADKVTLTWTDPTTADFDSVRIYAGTTANPTTWVASVAKGVQSYKDSAYSYNTIRHYRIKSKDVNGNLSNYSSSVNDTVMMNLGSELVTNGDFTSGVGWGVSGGTSAIEGGVAKIITTGLATTIYRAVACTTGLTYLLSFNHVQRDSGKVNYYYESIALKTIALDITSVGSYQYVFTAHDNNKLFVFSRGTSLEGTQVHVDNVSIKRILNP